MYRTRSRGWGSSVKRLMWQVRFFPPARPQSLQPTDKLTSKITVTLTDEDGDAAAPGDDSSLQDR